MTDSKIGPFGTEHEMKNCDYYNLPVSVEIPKYFNTLFVSSETRNEKNSYKM